MLTLTPPVQTYFVPLREDDLFTSFDTIQSNTSGDIVTIISVAIAADNTIIYYDHWEDDYEADVLNPTAPGTGIEIWGDGDLSNGARPGATTNAEDVLEAGDAIVLENTVPVDPRGTDIFYDASDRIQATFPIAVTRGGYPTTAGSFSPGTVLAGAVEVVDTDNWGTEFVVPVGEDTPGSSGTAAFEYTAIYIMAGEDNTEVFLNGGATPVATIDTGENYVVRVDQGDVVTTSSPAQADLVTGDIESTWETRSYSLAPRTDWSNDYYTPVGDAVESGNGNDGPTQVWLYNPDPDNSITVSYDFFGGSSPDGTITVGAGDTALSPAIPDNSGGRFFTVGGEDFFALTQTDSTGGTDNNGQTFDWGHPLIPANQLTSQALIGWGYGNTQNDPNFDSYNVVWVTPVEDADIFVDFDGDGTVDQTIDNASALQSFKITDSSDQDMTGALIYATDTSGILSNPVDIAVAWGQDPASTSTSSTVQRRSLDLGTVIPALPILEAGKTSTLDDDADGDGVISPGDTLLYSISIVNIGQVDLPASSFNVLDFFSPVFDDADYVLNSTQYDTDGDGNPNSPIADNGVTAFPLDEGGFTNTAALPKGGTQIITFKVVIDEFGNLTPGADRIINQGVLIPPGGDPDDPIDEFETEDPLNFRAEIDIEKKTNGFDADTPTGPDIPQGAPVTWTYEVTNTGDVWLNNIGVTDNPLGAITNRIDDGDGDLYLQPGETWIYQATGTAQLGQYMNTGTATGDPVYNDGTPVDGVDSPTDSDDSHYFGIFPIDVEVSIVKKTNDLDNQNPTIAEGGVVTWTYMVTNDGNIDINEGDISVSDNIEGAVTNIIDKGDGDGVLAQGETWTYQLTGTAQAGQYDNTGSVNASATDEFGNSDSDTDSEPDGYNGVNVDVEIIKKTNGLDNANATVPIGSPVTWTYEVTNNGTIGIAEADVSVSDSVEGPVTTIIDKGNNDSTLDIGETWTYELTGTAQAGNYTNDGTVEASFTDEFGNTDSDTDTEPDGYNGENPVDVEVSIVKKTNDLDNQNPTIAEGGDVTWTYMVTNDGNIDINEADISVTDNIEGPVTTIIDKGDNDGVLAQGETWTYELTGIAQAGPYSNEGTVNASATDEFGNSDSDTDSEPDGYNGVNVDVEIIKKTNGLDNANATVPIGSPVTWTYEVTNNGTIGIAEADVSVSDSVEGPVTTIIDKGNNDSTLDIGETWTYELTGTAQAGNYTNDGTVEASFTDEFGNTDSDTDTEPDGYFGVDARIEIDKVTDNGIIIGDGITVTAGQPITWTYAVTNPGNVGLSNVSVTDDQGVTPVFQSGDDGDGILENGETWLYTANGTAVAGAYNNVGTATGNPVDDQGNDLPGVTDPSDSDDSSYFGLEAPGVRTPGFWQNNKWQKFWDGIQGNEPKQAGQPDFPDGDLFHPPYTITEDPDNAGKVLDPVSGQYQTGVLIGDFNRNGMTDAGEDTLFYTTNEALDVIKASNKVQKDKRYTLARSLTASWLNYLAGNPAPNDDITDGIQWLQTLTPDENGDFKGDGALEDLVDGVDSPPIAASSAFWNSGISGPISSLPHPYDQNTGMAGALPLPAGNTIHGILDDYNNNGL